MPLLSVVVKINQYVQEVFFMINSFEFFLPTQIKFGRGAVKEVGEEISARGF